MSLPAEMVGDILERLPVKSLMRFKSVDPSWDSLIKTNSFISKHSQRQIQMQKEVWGSNEERFMMYYIDKMSSKHCITLLSCYEPPTPFHIENVELEYPSIHHPGYYLASTCIYGHCNGVICLAAALRNAENEFIEDTIVWNPATREVKLLPPLTHHAPLAYSDHIFIEEFAFCAAHGDTFNDFKFIQFYTDEYPDININTVVFAKVYNVNSNSWTIINDVHVSDIVNPDTPLDRVCFVGEIVFADGLHCPLPLLIALISITVSLIVQIMPPTCSLVICLVLPRLVTQSLKCMLH
ncbi:hypothetical protein RIF29_32259 [Crotalaria pallida]|uniref:F-box domain-containing protein n=1 Tax=Crotalaria pallida TaxID=3830 RepID=A0AAN9EHX7_CROPI